MRTVCFFIHLLINLSTQYLHTVKLTEEELQRLQDPQYAKEFRRVVEADLNASVPFHLVRLRHAQMLLSDFAPSLSTRVGNAEATKGAIRSRHEATTSEETRAD